MPNMDPTRCYRENTSHHEVNLRNLKLLDGLLQVYLQQYQHEYGLHQTYVKLFANTRKCIP
ncbi:hypothetical protein Mapa_018506 [Marchantia paleacea]|nr:hypothetical protein Mapa_018506 [Marchantia paleacea]